jgi:hypothetical protein
MYFDLVDGYTAVGEVHDLIIQVCIHVPLVAHHFLNCDRTPKLNFRSG